MYSQDDATYVQACALRRARLEAQLELERTQAACAAARRLDDELAEVRAAHVREIQVLTYGIERRERRIQYESLGLQEDEILSEQRRIKLQALRVAAECAHLGD